MAREALRVEDRRHVLHAVATRAREDVDTEPVLHELAEGRVARAMRSLLVGLGHHVRPSHRVSSEHPAVEHLVGARARHERTEPLQERVGAHRGPPRAVLPGALQLQGHLVGTTGAGVGRPAGGARGSGRDSRGARDRRRAPVWWPRDRSHSLSGWKPSPARISLALASNA
jgi:hypothetical protein